MVCGKTGQLCGEKTMHTGLPVRALKPVG
ncbi:hypothetical protein CBM2617_U10058 [Cupriavidus taiwanensis]|nr:hypothetical protein CBM2617_U10058 [Cupriavidus taiwanensis]SPA53790.1 hypothetical protein CBM2629_U10052 [Cupriavidus taiwanensis]